MKPKVVWIVNRSLIPTVLMSIIFQDKWIDYCIIDEDDYYRKFESASIIQDRLVMDLILSEMNIRQCYVIKGHAWEFALPSIKGLYSYFLDKRRALSILNEISHNGEIPLEIYGTRVSSFIRCVPKQKNFHVYELDHAQEGLVRDDNKALSWKGKIKKFWMGVDNYNRFGGFRFADINNDSFIRVDYRKFNNKRIEDLLKPIKDKLNSTGKKVAIFLVETLFDENRVRAMNGLPQVDKSYEMIYRRILKMVDSKRTMLILKFHPSTYLYNQDINSDISLVKEIAGQMGIECYHIGDLMQDGTILYSLPVELLILHLQVKLLLTMGSATVLNIKGWDDGVQCINYLPKETYWPACLRDVWEKFQDERNVLFLR